MPEGDAIHRTAERLRVLEGDIVRADSPHPRAALLGIAERIDGRRLERVEAVGKNLLLTFEDGTVVRSHLRMHGRWRVEPAGRPILGMPWLVLRGADWQAVQRRGPVLELGRGHTARLGPDIMAAPPDLDEMLVRFRTTGQSRALGEAILDQTLVAGIGNMWKAEALYAARLKPWVALRDVDDERLRLALSAAASLMRAPRGRRRHSVYRRAGRPCLRCGTSIRSWPQGDEARMAYWCPTCQEGTEPCGA
ncbi:MAG TPA: DNA-formamidopyrimidine glycosylase family protein [Gaiellaceae bacterium]|nr:DNA-formamidopyrimidine glycosylase family protein [Gaiellaceae bacterium]